MTAMNIIAVTALMLLIAVMTVGMVVASIIAS